MVCKWENKTTPSTSLFRVFSAVPVFRGVPVFRCSGVPVSGAPVFRFSGSGVPVFRCSGVPVFRCSGIPVFLLLVHADFRNSENEHFASIANRLVDYINDVILTGRLGTKPTVVNTKWPWHLSILPWIPDRLLLFIHVFVLRIAQSTSTNLSRGFYMIKPASRKAMVSNTTNIEVCDRHTRHR